MKKGIILTSFGTTHKDTLEKNILSLENLVAENFKEDFVVLRAFTSRIVAKRLKSKGMEVDNPTKKKKKMKGLGIKEIYIQPSLIIEGHEYEKIQREVRDFKEENPDYLIKIGQPLLSTDRDYEEVVRALDLESPSGDQALIFMGHGSDHSADLAYEKLEEFFHRAGHDHVYVGTVEGSINIDDIVARLDKSVTRAELRPFMLVAGDHATNDMASDEEDSWKSILEARGIEAQPKLLGLGELAGIREIFLEHLKEIM